MVTQKTAMRIVSLSINGQHACIKRSLALLTVELTSLALLTGELTSLALLTGELTEADTKTRWDAMFMFL